MWNKEYIVSLHCRSLCHAIVSICLLVIYASHAVVHAVCHGVHHLFTGNTNKDCYVFCILLCCVLYLLRVIVLWSGDCVVCYVCCVWLCCDPAFVFCATSAACDCVVIRWLCCVLHLLRVIVLWSGDCVLCYISCMWLCCDPVIVFCVGDWRLLSLITVLNVQTLLRQQKVCQEEKFPNLE